MRGFFYFYKMNRIQLFEQIKKKKSYLCVGLDTDIEKIPKHLINAFLAAEDRNFFCHSGISWKGIFRSILINLKNNIKTSLEASAPRIATEIASRLPEGSKINYEEIEEK